MEPDPLLKDWGLWANQLQGSLNWEEPAARMTSELTVSLTMTALP